MADQQLPKPRTMDAEKAKQVRAKRVEVMGRIDAVLAEMLPIYGKGN